VTDLRVIKLQLAEVYLEAIEGCGSELTLKLRAYRKTKAGTPERYELELKACRYSVKQLLDGLKQMHVRDRERIQGELNRIAREQNALQVTP
jgi:hypothetical protein